MSGAIPSLPQYAFMAWCSVKRSTGTTLLYLVSGPCSRTVALNRTGCFRPQMETWRSAYSVLCVTKRYPFRVPFRVVVDG
jgi:hypothetical protein